MRIEKNIAPADLINGIEVAKVRNRYMTNTELEKLRFLLRQAEHDNSIIRIARGEGRVSVMKGIMEHEDIVFGWGMKAAHAYHKQTIFRDFLEPGNVNATEFKELIEQYAEAIRYRLHKYFEWGCARAKENRDIQIEELCDIIDYYENDHLFLEVIKDWLCAVLQTSGDKNFRCISPWISASMGENRFSTAYTFGRGRPEEGIKRFVILDAWVYPDEEHFAFEKTLFLIDTLRELSLPWFADIHSEIMMKYGIYPHRLIGYYYFENDELLYYQVNPHYVDEWKKDPDFKIGDYVHIDQDCRFQLTANPYRLIYARNGDKFSVKERFE